jgi:osmoprotectant transport system permease protein
MPAARAPAWLCALAAWLLLLVAPALAAEPLKVGSKRFTESYILGEVLRLQLQAQGVAAVHRPGLGNTGILAQALASGAIDVYPEYTGTIVRELLQREGDADAQASLEQINAWLAPRGLKAVVPLGFNNTYALAMREADAQRLGIARISDLARLAAGALKLGLSHEFVVRADGWPALQRAYGLAFVAGSGLDHGLAYEALRGGQVDLIDVYTTDAQLGRGDLRVLQDDRRFFPAYDAVLLMRAAIDPAPLQALAGEFPASRMVALNAEVELDGRPYAEVAQRFMAARAVAAAASAAGVMAPASAAAAAAASGSAAARPSFSARLFAPDLPRLLGQHLLLVFGSLALAIAAGVPLGVLAWQRPRLAGVVLSAVGVLQTIPSLALLALLIAWLGVIGFVPALLALFTYALLPIVRNTHAGLAAVPQGLPLAALALGLRRGQVLRCVELPLALPTLWAGIKTAAVINVGTATVAAFIGAGGLGERIVAGLAVNDMQLALAGALPAAVLALLVQWLFDGAERCASIPNPHRRHPT